MVVLQLRRRAIIVRSALTIVERVRKVRRSPLKVVCYQVTACADSYRQHRQSHRSCENGNPESSWVLTRHFELLDRELDRRYSEDCVFLLPFNRHSAADPANSRVFLVWLLQSALNKLAAAILSLVRNSQRDRLSNRRSQILESLLCAIRIKLL